MLNSAPWASMLPSEAVGDWTPSPTKLSPASPMIAKAKIRVSCTDATPSRLGTRWRVAMRTPPTPLTRAEST